MLRLLILLSLISCAPPTLRSPSCTASKTGTTTTINCPDGSVATIQDGMPGENGISGTNGTSGSNGTNGIDAPGIVVITLCPTIAGSYPEVVFKINGFLYAVYYDSANGAHEALISPGVYRTTDGRSCYFTVNSDLTISY